MYQEKISVIVPIYKVEDYLEKCLKSIIKQTYSNLEIILVDDGSPDKCPAICDSYAAKDNRIRVIHKNNGGLSSARNAGIEIASGEYLAFVDSDDYIHPQMYEILIAKLKENDADISASGIQWMCNNVKIRYSGSGENCVCTGKEAVWNIFDKECYVPSVSAWNKIYKKELFENIRYPEGKIHEDEFTTYQLLWNADKVVYCAQALYYYVQRNGSIMNSGWTRGRLDGLEAYKSMMRFFADKKESALYNEAAYRYLYLIRDNLSDLSKIQGEKNMCNKLRLIFKKDYKKFRSRFRIKRRIRMGIFCYFGISI